MAASIQQEPPSSGVKICASTGAMLSMRPIFRSTRKAANTVTRTAEDHTPVHNKALDITQRSETCPKPQ
jgi:hypothetical protein